MARADVRDEDNDGTFGRPWPSSDLIGAASAEVRIDLIGAASYHLRVFNLAGELVLERTMPEVQSMLVEDLVDHLGRMMKVASHRLSLLQGTSQLDPKASLHTLWPPLSDMDLQVLLGPLDSSHVPIDPGRILHVERSDRAAAHAAAELGLSVQFEPGEVREAVYQVKCHHEIVVSTPCLFEHDTWRVERHKADEADAGTLTFAVEEENKRASLAMGFYELIMYYSSVKVVSWVTKDFEHEVLGRASSAELTCRAAKLSGLCKLTVLMMSYWIVVCVSVVSALCLTIVAGSQQNMWQCISLAATLWLPGFVWTYRYHCFLLGRKCVGIGAILGLPVCVLSWCCGVIWLWAPAAVMLWSVLFPLAPSCKLMCLLLRVSGCHSWDPPYPIQTQSFTLYEIYARDLQMWGDAPRVLLVIGMHISSFPPSNDTWSFLDVTVISSSLLSLVFSLVPFRRRLRRETWQYFDETIMELVSD